MKGFQDKCVEAGCTAFLTKPIDFEKLQSTLAEHLSGAVSRQEQPKSPTNISDNGLYPTPFDPFPGVSSRMNKQAIIKASRQLTSVTASATVPGLVEVAGAKWKKRFVEFLVAEYRNKNTRAAYYRALGRFFAWCEAQGVQDLHQVEPTIVAL